MKTKRIILSILLSLLTTYSLSNYILKFFSNIYYFFIPIIILLFVYYYFLNKDIKIERRYNIFSIVLSIILVILHSYYFTHTTKLIIGNILNFLVSIIKVVGFYFFIRVLVFYLLKFLNKEYTYKNKYINKFITHPFLYSFIFLSVCYLIYLVFYYPGILNYDNANQIREMMGLHTRYIDAINPISNSMLTNFNPIVHTFLLGGLFKIGHILNNDNLGLFFFTILQLITLITSISYVISYSINKKANPLITLIVLLFLGINPLFGFYSITLVKDVIYTAFLLIYSLKIYDINNSNKTSIEDYISLFIIAMLVSLFRNNGIIIVIASMPFIFYKNKNIIKVYGLVLLVYFAFVKIILPMVGVSGTSVREVLSIPFQQTARVVKYNKDNIEEIDKIAISKVIDYDNLPTLYKRTLADPVKNTFNKDASSSDLRDYILSWMRLGIKYPLIYVDAFMNNISGYFNPFESKWRVYHNLNPELNKEGFDYHYNNLELGREILFNYEKVFDASPLGLLNNISIISWVSILLFIRLCNKKKYVLLLPNIISIFFCLLSPANTYFRYIYPSLILLVCLFPLIKLECEKTR